jgi:glycosyltransferase involved in cell wall biosynthesis
VQLNYLASNYRFTDGYGRYNTFLIRALERLGVTVYPQHTEMANAAGWVQERLGMDWKRLTISCLPPFYLNRVPGAPRARHWLLSMTEGSRLPAGWCETIQRSGVERIIVPCQHNAEAFAVTGLPVHVVPGGTDPDEFPPIDGRPADRPYTFLAIADRGARKGWVETWQAFYQAFGTPTDTPDVRLIIKSRPDGNDMLAMIAEADKPDPRITILMEDMDMRVFYRMGDCFVGVSRSEGWGMLPREAACMGLPVITQAHAGLDDGHTCEWAFVVDGGRLEPIPAHFDHIAGDWMKADVVKLATMMRLCYGRPHMAAQWGAAAAMWIRGNQTWAHSAKALLALIGEHDG